MTKMVSLTIDGKPVEVPEGILIVDAAKMHDIDIPVFCYHPKMEPVGMCRMCLVDIGRPMTDRATGQPVLNEDGTPKIQFGPKLETACTTPVSPGMVVVGTSDKVKAGREDILEFLLTSHPLDCPICDKGGECPLQNLTLHFGPGQSRFILDEKKHLAKHVPLGELIYLDRERCIQCARCVRFQENFADDPVIGFNNRGRAWEIVTYSDPGFDSYWSGNTSDICPVGALTTADFRFRARPWELRAAASICTQCPVGCNVTLNVRREAGSGGSWVVKRVMPRQNEQVNEIWICDKGRFGYHFADIGNDRLKEPLVRKNGELQPVSWEEALTLIGERFRAAGKGLLTLAGGRLPNEDLYNLRKLTEGLGGKPVLYTHMDGGDLTSQVGIPPETNFGTMGKDSVILVAGCDLEEEGPVWWLRVHQAVKRGAKLILLNARLTKLNRDATISLRYPFGAAAATVLAMVNSLSRKQPELVNEAIQELERSQALKDAAALFAGAKDAVILYGSDGMGLAETRALAQACANLLITTNHVGRPNNGLLGVWPRANDQGAWELGWRPSQDLTADLNAAQLLYIVAADPVGDNPAFQPAFGDEKFVVVQELYLTATARLADVVLPVHSWSEREGTFTNGERRVQRFYPGSQPVVVPEQKVEVESVRRPDVLTVGRILYGPQNDFVIAAHIGEHAGVPGLVNSVASVVFARLAKEVPAFAGLSYQKLSEVQPQWPIVGRDDLYYGGTTYENSQGLGKTLALTSGAPVLAWPQVGDFKLPKLGAMAFPVTRLYDQGTALTPSELLCNRIGDSFVVIGPDDAARLKVEGDHNLVRIVISETGQNVVVKARVSEELPERVVLAPRSYGLPVDGPTPIEIKPA